jgi:oligopeptidase B
LNRGVICVVAHVRGGGEKGRQWYEGGKGLNKIDSIHDFVQVAEWLVETKRWTTPDMLACEGRSAGGLLVGAAINQEPSLFRVAILGVPFLDTLVTMTDPSLPLTVMEWEEWGNPNELIHFENIRQYSPLQNIQSNQPYPSCLLIGGLHDPRVAYWEPLKFAAALRYSTTLREDRPVCVKIETSAGHSFGSNRGKYFEELAFIYAFMLDQLDLTG